MDMKTDGTTEVHPIPCRAMMAETRRLPGGRAELCRDFRKIQP
jgi:hypothetical protein